jgi:ribosome maturation factor RimP
LQNTRGLLSPLLLKIPEITEYYSFIPAFQPITIEIVNTFDMINESAIRGWIDEHFAGSDLFLVDLFIKPGNRIRIFIDSDTSVLIEHCIGLSKFIESHLDRDIEDFELNVSSSGLDQPYKIARQYIKNVGREVAVSLNDGRKAEGTLTAADEQGFEILEKLKDKKNIIEVNHRFNFIEIKETKEIIKF